MRLRVAASVAAFSSSAVSGSRSRPHATPTVMAVSCLSPVMTQTRMRAASSVRMASGTPACSLSSTPVAPSSDNARSASATTAASRAASNDTTAAWYLSESCTRPE